MKKVSIIIPVYNAEKFIEKGIKSVLSQTYKNIELILINDGSRDNSLNIIKKWENEYPNIIKVFDQKNMGVGKTRNKGIEVSTGDYITFIDADDYIDVDFIQVLLDNALDNDIIISGYRRIDENGNVIFSQKLKSNDWSKFKQVTIWSKLYKKEFFVIVSKDHPLADRKEISFKEVLEETFILLDEHHVHMTAFKRLNARFDDLAQSTVVLTDSNLVLSFIEENLGIGLMTDLTLFPEYPNLVKIPLVEEEKTVFYISYAYPNEGDPKRFLAPLLNG